MYNLQIIDQLFLPHCSCDISLSVSSGEMITLVGGNGIGKTTLVQRFYQDYAEQTSIVEQKPLDIFYDRNLGKIKEFFLDAGGTGIDKEFFLKAWSLFNLSSKEDRMQSSLSGGEGQILKIALGLAPNRNLFILDEPSHYLDDSMKNVLNTLLESLIHQGKSIIMIEHDYSWAKLPMKMVELEQINTTLKIGKSWTI